MTRALFAFLIALAWRGCAGAVLSDTVNQIPQPGANFMRQLQEFSRDEDSDRFHENACKKENFVYSGCLGGSAAGLSHTPQACIGYARGFRTTETGSIVYPDETTCWVILDRNISGDLVTTATFSRVLNTHYLISCGAMQPAKPAGTVWLMAVTTTGGAIVTVQDIREFGDCTGGGGAGLCTQQVGESCTTTSQCCDGFCFLGVCSAACLANCASCVALGGSCAATVQCCEGFCMDGVCTTGGGGPSSSTTTTPVTTTTTTTTLEGALEPGDICITIPEETLGMIAYEFFMAPVAFQVTEVSCVCHGDCTAPTAQILLTDRAGNAISTSGFFDGSFNCTDDASDVTWHDVSADPDSNFVPGEGLAFRLINDAVPGAPGSEDQVTLCVHVQ